MRRRVLRLPIVFLRVPCSSLILLIKTVPCSIIHCITALIIRNVRTCVPSLNSRLYWSKTTAAHNKSMTMYVMFLSRTERQLHESHTPNPAYPRQIITASTRMKSLLKLCKQNFVFFFTFPVRCYVSLLPSWINL